ncbi:MAG: CPBP family intramembrane metalloprotease [Candidatus Saccharibacteria bacterium]|nr:CPBP family intramembrane metalloprotease [Candidatus Saccharibacteria bacterium]
MKKLLEKFENFRKKHPVPKKLRTPLAILSLLLWVAIASIGAQYLVGYLLLWTIGVDRLGINTFNVLYQVISYAVTLFLVIYVPYKISKKGKTTREEIGLKGWPTWTDIWLSPLGFIAATLIAMALAALFSLFPWFNADEAQNIGYTTLLYGSDRIFSFIATAIIAPIVEEIVFRGWLYGKIRSRLNMFASIFIVSLLFGLVHMQWNVGVNVFATSIVLCALREMTGTIYSGILVHIIKNGIAFCLVYIMGIGL